MYSTDKSISVNVGDMSFYYLHPRGMSDYIRGASGTDAAEYISADESIILYRSSQLWGARRMSDRCYGNPPTYKTPQDALDALRGM